MSAEFKVLSKSKELAKLVFITFKDDVELRFTYFPQMARSSLSIASNIAEGSQRGSKKEYARFINIARGSLKELQIQLEILQSMCDKGSIRYKEIQVMLLLTDEIGRMTYNLKLSLKT